MDITVEIVKKIYEKHEKELKQLRKSYEDLDKALKEYKKGVLQN